MKNPKLKYRSPMYLVFGVLILFCASWTIAKPISAAPDGFNVNCRSDVCEIAVKPVVKSGAESVVEGNIAVPGVSIDSKAKTTAINVPVKCETISIPFAKDGIADECYTANGTVDYINSWNMDYVEVNGKDFTNAWASGKDIPASNDGSIHITYQASVPWAHFEIKGENGTQPKVYTLSTSVVGNGTISDVDGEYTEGTVVSLTATPAEGYIFKGWSGDVNGNASTISITMDGNKSVTANFIESSMPSALISLGFNDNSGSSVSNTGNASAAFSKTAPPSWSTNVPVNGGVSSVDFGTGYGNYYVESNTVINELAQLSGFTVTGWVNNRNSTVGSGGNRIVSWINNGGNGVDIVYNSNGSLSVGINEWPDQSNVKSSAGKIPANASVPASNWRFFAVTYESSSGNLSFYFGDNSLAASLDKTVSYNQGIVGTNIGKLAIGHFNEESGRASRTDRMFRGLIDQVEIYSSALSQQDIQAVQNSGGTTIPVTSVTVSPTDLSLNVGETTRLTALVFPSDATNKAVNWSSSNTAVATVNSSGLVAAKSKGSSTITVATQDGGFTASCIVTVSEDIVPVTGVSVSPNAASLPVGKTIQLTATVEPSHAMNKNVSWSSSNTAVATVNSSGLVKGLAKGTATITATTEDRSYTATCKLTTISASLKICPLGNSITQANSSHVSYRYPLWKKLIDANIPFDFVGTMNSNKGGSPSWPDYNGQAFDRDHEGHWGWRANQVRDEIQGWLSGYTPDMVLIHIGTNDCYHDKQNASGIISEITQIIKYLREDNPNVVIFLASLIPCKNVQSYIDALNVEIPKCVEVLNTQASPVIFVDMASVVTSRDLYDGIHPGPSGEEKMAQKWFDAINTYLSNTIPVKGVSVTQRAATDCTEFTLTIHENDIGFCGVEGSIDNNNPGFTGDGFAKTDNAVGNGSSVKGATHKQKVSRAASSLVVKQLYPNPVNSLLYIEFSKTPVEPVTIYLLDIAGKPVTSVQTSDMHNSVDMSGLPDGLYLVRIKGMNLNEVKYITKY